MEVAFEPYKKVSFQSYFKYESSEAFAHVIALSNPPGIPVQRRLFWANGVLFRFFSHPPSEALSREIVNGHLIWDHVEFAPMPAYKNVLKVVERPLVMINVLNVSDHVIFGPVSKWIYDNLIKKRLPK
jgi:hypothetical protein